MTWPQLCATSPWLSVASSCEGRAPEVQSKVYSAACPWACSLLRCACRCALLLGAQKGYFTRGQRGRGRGEGPCLTHSPPALPHKLPPPLPCSVPAPGGAVRRPPPSPALRGALCTERFDLHSLSPQSLTACLVACLAAPLPLLAPMEPAAPPPCPLQCRPSESQGTGRLGEGH